MNLRKAEDHELDTIYGMGFDIWGDGLSLDAYLMGCRDSDKYLAGTWYVLVEKDQVVSSLIVYEKMFGLKEGCFGLGSVATHLKSRQKGYASALVNLVKAELFANHNCKVLYLHNDIDKLFYSKLGFVSIQGSDCMFYSKNKLSFGSVPSYF
ncbi:GNAT family N-acetyltransferase [Photobacterium swingsii]|uniref:GNAT family N-acetyltransferase n=1 Tax=Photobacterium swingsii TaxID=680026 RepID=UPI004069779D